jgi:hypothetical protein
MPNDSMREEIEPIRRAALAYLASTRTDAPQADAHLRALTNCEARLVSEIDERGRPYSDQLNADEAAAIGARRTEVEQNSKYQRASEEQKAAHQTFDNLRRINGGSYPRNISPVLYIIPLILVGIAEWYVNFATFSAMFIPVFAIAATLIVAAVFCVRQPPSRFVSKANIGDYTPFR